MTSRDFCYWLQGFFELDSKMVAGNSPAIGDKQAAMIKNHLAMVFKHELDAPDPTGALRRLHDGIGGVSFNC